MGDFTIQFGRLVAYRGENTQIVVPDGVTVIGRRAFYKSKVTDVTLPDTVTEIEQEAFLYARLKHIEMRGAIKKVGANAFLCGTGVERSIYPQIPIARFAKSDQPHVFYYFVEHAEISLYEPDVYRQNLAFIGKHLLKECGHHTLYWDVLAENNDLLAPVFGKGFVSQKDMDSLIAHLINTNQTDKIARILQYYKAK